MNDTYPTPKQKEILASFRSTVADILQVDHDDFFLLRFLRARNFNEEKAEIMLRKHMKWRKEMRIDNYFEHYQIPEVFEKYHPGGFIGHDREGCPVWLIPGGSFDIKGFLMACKSIDFLKYQIWRFEMEMKYMKEQSKKLNKRISKRTYILDEENLNIAEVLNKDVMEILLKVFRVFDENYPETLKRCFIINVPKLFYVFYSFVKPLLSEETASKVRIYGYDGWKEDLLADIDPSILPVHWGGERTDPETGDPRCQSMINPGGPIPSCYYFSKQNHLSQQEDTTAVLIPKRTFVDVRVQVPEIDSVIQWDIQTDENDLAIGLFFERSGKGGDLQVIMESKRTECCRAPESGTFVCPKAGTCINPTFIFSTEFLKPRWCSKFKDYLQDVLRLDNMFSWFKSKTAHYRITVSTPKSNIL